MKYSFSLAGRNGDIGADVVEAVKFGRILRADPMKSLGRDYSQVISGSSYDLMPDAENVGYIGEIELWKVGDHGESLKLSYEMSIENSGPKLFIYCGIHNETLTCTLGAEVASDDSLEVTMGTLRASVRYIYYSNSVVIVLSD